jgi:hypothetical protein
VEVGNNLRNLGSSRRHPLPHIGQESLTAIPKSQWWVAETDLVPRHAFWGTTQELLSHHSNSVSLIE